MSPSLAILGPNPTAIVASARAGIEVVIITDQRGSEELRRAVDAMEALAAHNERSSFYALSSNDYQPTEKTPLTLSNANRVPHWQRHDRIPFYRTAPRGRKHR